MAGDWIKMRADLANDPSVFRIRTAIGDDKLQIVGRLHVFWSWVDKHCVDGHVDGATSLLIDEIAMKDGFASALIDAGWLVIDTKGASIPNFDRHNGESAKERGLKNARQARWRRNRDGVVDGVVDGVASTVPSTREEKRREEKKELKDSSSPSADDRSGENSAAEKPAKAERLRQVTGEAVAAYNAILGKPNGLLAAVQLVNEVRENQVKRCLGVAREICQRQYGAPVITAQFWQDYFDACKCDPFLAGEVQGGRGHENYKPDFELLTRKDKMTAVFDKAMSEAAP